MGTYPPTRQLRLTVCVDGVPVPTTAEPWTVTPPDEQFSIGGTDSGDDATDGQLADCGSGG